MKKTAFLLLILLMISLTSCKKNNKNEPNTSIGETAVETVIKMELDANYDESDPFVNARLFCVSESIDILDAYGTFQMEGESGVMEIKDNKTDEVLWSNTWQGSVDHDTFKLSLEHMQKEKEYAVWFTGTGINHAVLSISFESDMVRELERPGLSQTASSREEVSQDIKDCIREKMTSFGEECTLTDLWYDKEKSDAIIDSYMKYGQGSQNGVKRENVIVILSNLRTGANTGSFEPNTVYTDWNWILVRKDQDSEWMVDDYGNE